MRLFIGIASMFSLLFLFGGLAAVGVTGDELSSITASDKAAHDYVSRPVTEKYSMKQIDSLTSTSNYTFTSDNTEGSAVLP